MKQIFKTRLDNCRRVGEGLVDIGGLKLSAKAYESAAKIDHIARTKAFDKETCIIQGTADVSVPFEFGLEYKENMKNVTFHSIEGADHTFTRVDWEEKVLDITTSFFRKTL
jgi:pimeloyl-ACP methyl ester carboxylesterase